MSLDRSLKSGGSLAQHRSVLTRAERITKLKNEGEFGPNANPLGLPKTISPRLAVRKKVKVKKAEGAAEGAAEGDVAAPAAAPVAAAPAAKGKKK